jgi:oxygen-independent coproporphyrinogen-3 oxidase
VTSAEFPVRAAYLHVPFCAHHCNYCDFAVAAGRDHWIDRYLDALGVELTRLGQPHPIETLFLGGGTPTHLAPRQLDRLLDDVIRWLPPVPGYEFSVEANPSSLDADKVKVLAGHGVTRVSLGAQSFQPPLLAVLERDHGPDDVTRAVALVKKYIGRVSIDLIFGVPSQTVEAWGADLNRAVDLDLDHLSTYGLTYEKGTRLWKQRQQGKVRPLDEDTELAQYELAMDRLEAAGFEQYEISSFARRDETSSRRCRHNLVYWANEPYLGFGVGAARYVDGRRELNTRDLASYIERALAGEATTFQSEKLEADERARETMAIQLRRAEGIGRFSFQAQTGWNLDALAGEAIRRQVELGLLADDGGSVRLTRRGKCLGDAVICELLKEGAVSHQRLATMETGKLGPADAIPLERLES